MKPARRTAFSLVEVAVAIGIVSFCLLTLVSLLGTGLNTSRLSKEDTLLASAASQVTSELWSQTHFTLPATYTFDTNGISVANDSSASLYQCSVSSLTLSDTDILGKNVTLPMAALVFRWPLPSLRNTATFYVPIPQH